MYIREDVFAVIVMVGLFIAVMVGLFFTTQWIKATQCREAYKSFENKYSYFEGCLIKVDGKWIPSTNYRVL